MMVESIGQNPFCSILAALGRTSPFLTSFEGNGGVYRNVGQSLREILQQWRISVCQWAQLQKVLIYSWSLATRPPDTWDVLWPDYTKEPFKRQLQRNNSKWLDNEINLFIGNFLPKLPRLVKLYNSVQMFEPFWDQNQLFFGMISLSKFFMQDFRKQIGSVGLGPNHSGNIFWGKIWIFVEVIFFDPTDRETIPSQTSDMGKKTASVLAHTFSQP